MLFLGKIHFLITEFKYRDESCSQNEGGILYLAQFCDCTLTLIKIEVK